MRYLLDTDVLIDLSRGVEPTSARVRDWMTAYEEVAICAIQIAEFLSGISPADREAQRRFLQAFAVWEIHLRAAVRAGAYRYDLARLGVQVGTPDALIAAVAWEHSAALVTRNVRHFPMTDIRVVSL